MNLGEIDHLTSGRLGTFDVPCPYCGPDRQHAVNRRRPVLRIWRPDDGFASYSCARCGLKGFARDDAPPIDRAKVARATADAAKHAATHGRSSQ